MSKRKGNSRPDPDAHPDVDMGEAFVLALRGTAGKRVREYRSGLQAHCPACRDFYDRYGTDPAAGDTVYTFVMRHVDDGHECELLQGRYVGREADGGHRMRNPESGYEDVFTDHVFRARWSRSLRMAATLAVVRICGAFTENAHRQTDGAGGTETAIAGLGMAMDMVQQRYGEAVAESTSEAILVEHAELNN